MVINGPSEQEVPDMIRFPGFCAAFVFGALAFLGAGCGTTPTASQSAELQCKADDAACQRLCARGDAVACYLQGDKLERAGDGASEGKAVAAYKRGCDLGDDRACVGYGLFLRAGRGGLAANDAEAMRLLTRGCEAKVERGCQGLARSDGPMAAARADREVGPSDRADPVRQCERGDEPSCIESAIQLAGTGQASRAADTLEQACHLKVAVGCTYLAHLLMGGDIRRDPSRAMALYTIACDSDEPVACLTLGTLRERAAPAQVAFNLYEKACALKNADACYNSGALLLTRVYARSMEQIRERFQQACGLGDTESCRIDDELAMDSGRQLAVSQRITTREWSWNRAARLNEEAARDERDGLIRERRFWDGVQRDRDRFERKLQEREDRYRLEDQERQRQRRDSGSDAA
jgi:TPR repeat protein